MFKKLFRKETKAENARHFKRLRTTFLLKYRSEGGVPKTANLINLGAGGVRFATKEEIPVSSRLTLTIHTPPLNRFVEAQAVVSRVEKEKRGQTYAVAAAFVDLKAEDRTAINQYIEALYQNEATRPFVDHNDVVHRKQ
jgi:hypothetical protein